jgi:peptide deformylase
MTNWKPTLPPFRKYKKDNLGKYSLVSQFVYQLGESELLKKPSKDIPLNKIKTQEYQAKFNYLKKCQLDYRKSTGVGRVITAVQVGIPERFSVVYFRVNEKSSSAYLGPQKMTKKIRSKNLLVIINPKITKVSKEKLLYPEMCMSAVPVVAPVIRPAWIEFEYYDEAANKKIWDTKDDTDFGRMMNRVFQHEIDHMEGIMNIFMVSDPKLLFLESDPKFYNKAKFEKA